MPPDPDPVPIAQFQAASDQSLLVTFGHEIRPEVHMQVLKLLRLLQREPQPAIRNLHPAYASLLVDFDGVKYEHQQITDLLKNDIERLEDVLLPEPRHVEIPVCYGGEFGPDLAEVAQICGLSPEAVAEAHAAAPYIAYFLGFAPGFAYLGELPESLATPRLAHPRKQVPAGSVAIAGRQTAVYPLSTPGGWRLIGRTPISMFQPGRRELALLSPGDRVRFRAISAEEFASHANP